MYTRALVIAAVKTSPQKAASQVIKIPDFEGRLGKRALYIYLPASYTKSQKHYPVIYMHDGQNVFEAFVHDSYIGSWRADETADKLIATGEMRPSIIVGVSNGQDKRLSEYLPPYASFKFHGHTKRGKLKKRATMIEGRADETFAFYQDDVMPYLQSTYRVLSGRENRATCGSSMGGLLSTYIAWEHPSFAARHAALSPSYWVTKNDAGKLETLERIRGGKKRPLKLWLDSGEGTEALKGGSDDNKFVTIEAREALLAAGYVEGQDFIYHLAKGAKHNEASWAARLGKVFRFLMPPV